MELSIYLSIFAPTLASDFFVSVFVFALAPKAIHLRTSSPRTSNPVLREIDDSLSRDAALRLLLPR